MDYLNITGIFQALLLHSIRPPSPFSFPRLSLLRDVDGTDFTASRESPSHASCVYTL